MLKMLTRNLAWRLAGCACAGLMTVPALAQGDPQRAFDAATAAARKPGTAIRIDLIGDSTQTDNAGYGRGFCANFTAQVDCVNMARGGASTHTFRDDGIWARAMATKPDYMVIQFGHNDAVDAKNPMPRQTPLPDYIANLKRFVTEARAAGITPVLCTPLTRRYFQADGKIHSDLTEYSDAMKGVAREMKVPLIDLQTQSIAYLDKIGEAEGTKLGITKKDVEGSTIPDKTHLNWAGSYVFGRMVAVGLGAAVPAVKKYVLPEGAKLPPAGEKAMRIFEGAPVKIVLVGDSTVATGGGWGPGFCAVMTPNVTCIDDALNGRTTKSFIDQGAWQKALDRHGDYYFIQFGHNDQKPQANLPVPAFETYLQRYVDDVRAIGAVPVLVTSLSRRTFRDGKVVQDLTEYANATKEVGAKNDITVIDLNAISTRMLNGMTQAQADRFDKNADPETGKLAASPAASAAPDNVTATASGIDRPAASAASVPAALDRTHLNPYGQKVFGRIVADQMVRTLVELGPDVIGAPAGSGAMPAPPAVRDGSTADRAK
jgi:lysophospholipase L1-like esterase